MKHRVAIALGSNIGDAAGNIRTAFAHLGAFVQEARLSTLYASSPMYLEDQPRFVNAVAVGETDMDPLALLAALKGLESELGRVESVRNGPRLIDLDVVLYGDAVVNLPELQVPHPRMGERPFVMIPLCDLAAGWVHPVSGQSMTEIAETLDWNEQDLHALA